jgi:Jagunal, ER re-organisation during oogenesis
MSAANFARPQGSDGSDHSFRQVIVKRYELVAVSKKTIHFLALPHVVLALILAAFWYSQQHSQQESQQQGQSSDENDGNMSLVVLAVCTLLTAIIEKLRFHRESAVVS